MATRSTGLREEDGSLLAKPPCFLPYHSSNKSYTFLKDLYTLITSPLTPQENERGDVYGFQRKGEKNIKIGYSRVSVQSRIRVWERLCNQKIVVVLEEHVLHAKRVEKLVHLTLYHERRKEDKCRGCGRVHIEWFEVALERAKDVLAIWKQWIDTEPYDKDGKLKPVWVKHIDKLQMDKMNSSLESWRDWIELMKATTVGVKKESTDETETAASTARAKTEIRDAESDLKGEVKVKTGANTQELKQELRSLRSNFLDSIGKIKIETPSGNMPKTCHMAGLDLSHHISGPLTASPVTIAAA